MTLFGYEVLSFDGRMNRQPYILVPIVLNFISALIIMVVGEVGTMVSIVNAVFLLIGLSFHVRRLHDLDKSGMWAALLFIPLVNFVFCLYLIFCKGTDGPNTYGPDPLQ